MIPAFNQHGDLPAGVPPASLDELVDRFGRGSEQREAQGQSLRWLAPICVRAGIERILVNGSFVTNKHEPNDVDCVALSGPAYDDDPFRGCRTQRVYAVARMPDAPTHFSRVDFGMMSFESTSASWRFFPMDGRIVGRPVNGVGVMQLLRLPADVVPPPASHERCMGAAKAAAGYPSPGAWVQPSLRLRRELHGGRGIVRSRP